MELNFDYKEGCYLFNGTSSPEVVLHKTTYKLATIQFDDWGDYKPFRLNTYDLTNRSDVETLNERYTKTASEQDPSLFYGVELGTIIEYDYKQMIFLRLVDKKILNFVLQRPLLFDYIQARDKYLVALGLDNIVALQTEFTLTWEQYFKIPLQSDKTIEWEVISEPIPLNLNVNESLIEEELGDKFTDDITIYDILGFIDTERFNNIPNEEIKDEITKLIKKTLEIAKENQAVGKEDPNKKPKPKMEKFFVELTYEKDGEQLTEVQEVEATSEFDALEFAKKIFYDKYEGQNNVKLLFTSALSNTNIVAPKEDETVIEPVKTPKTKQNKKTQEEILSQIDEVDPEDLLSLLEEI